MRYILLPLLVLACLIALSATAQNSQPDSAREVILIRTIDGDTIVVQDGKLELHVRLFGVDAPELKAGKAAAFDAAAFLAHELESARAISIEQDSVALKDDFGRTLAWLWVKDSKGADHLVQRDLLASGLAELYPRCQSKRYSLKPVSAAARLPVLPIATAVQAPLPSALLQLASGDTVVYITATGKKYHRGSCRSLKKSKIKTTLAKAKAQGYKPCKVCKPPK